MTPDALIACGLVALGLVALAAGVAVPRVREAWREALTRKEPSHV